MANAQDVPPGAKAVIAAATKACKAANGLRFTLAPDAIRSIDLTGDGRADLIVSFEDSNCERVNTMFCGTGGCDLAIVVALPGGRYREVFRQQVLRYTVEDGAGARTIRFDLHGTYCGKVGPEPCAKRHVIDGRPFRFRQP